MRRNNPAYDILTKLLRFSLGTDSDFTLPEDVLWEDVVELAKKHNVIAVACDGYKRLCTSDTSFRPSLENKENEQLKYNWFGTSIYIEEKNRKIDSKARSLTEHFANEGYRSCILKGQGNALLYSRPALRQPGDIDIWVAPAISSGSLFRDSMSVIRLLKKRFPVSEAVYHHVQAKIFKSLAVEVHYTPAWMYDPVSNRCLQKFFASEADAQFSNATPLGFNVPTPALNLVFSASHLSKHTLDRNICLKQLMDYYYILASSSPSERARAAKVLDSVGLSGFIGHICERLEEELGMPSEWSIGKRTFLNVSLREILWFLPWKVWHLGWRLYVLISVALMPGNYFASES